MHSIMFKDNRPLLQLTSENVILFISKTEANKGYRILMKLFSISPLDILTQVVNFSMSPITHILSKYLWKASAWVFFQVGQF